MKHPHWSEIHFYFREFQQQKKQLESKKLTPEVLTTIRNSLATSMNHLKNNLKQTLDEQSVYLITFALTGLLDEEIQRIIHKVPGSAEWVPLQKELFNLTNAGEIFFENLDEILEAPQFPSIVFEVYYLALKKGFRGKYEHSPNRIAKYIEFLADKVQEPAIAKKNKVRHELAPLPKIKFKVWQYYAAAAVLVACAYFAMALNTNLT